MSKPLLVSVCGSEGIGISVACERIAITLNALKIRTVVVPLNTPAPTEKFEDQLILGHYKHYDCVLLIRHGFTHVAVKRNLSKKRWRSDSIRPDFAVLVTCSKNTLVNRLGIKYNCPSDTKERILRNHVLYESLDIKHWGARRVYTVASDGVDGRLYAAGNILHLIKQELYDAKNAVA